MDKKNNIIPIPIQRKKTFRFLGVFAFSITITEVIEFDHDEYYNKMREQLSSEILKKITGMVNNS